VPKHTQTKVPQHTLHKPSGRGRVRLNKVDFYTGVWGTPEATATYDRLIGEWLAAGRRLLGHNAPRTTATAAGITVAELVIRYDDYCRERLGEKTSNTTVRPALRRLRRNFGDMPAAAFEARHLCQLQVLAVEERDAADARLSRRYINNKIVGRIKTLFKWAAHPSREYVPVSVFTGLAVVEPLKRRDTTAPDTMPIRPVGEDVIESTLAHLPEVVADMVRFQRRTGARPGEVCRMTWSEIDRTGEVWAYSPAKHKTAHHGKERHVHIGPRAQAVLIKYLNRPHTAAIFSPLEAMRTHHADRRAELLEQITTALATTTDSLERKRLNQRRWHLNTIELASTHASLTDEYTPTTYGQAIARACTAAGVERWAPNRLRHNAATEIRRTIGLDAAGAVLGHAKVDVTQVYAERQHDLAASVAKKLG